MVPKNILELFQPWMQKNCFEKSWDYNGTELAGEFNKVALMKGHKQTRQWVRLVLLLMVVKNDHSNACILYSYTKDSGYKYIQKLAQLVSILKLRKDYSLCLIPTNVKHSEFKKLLYSRSIRDEKKTKNKIGEKNLKSVFDCFSGSKTNHNKNKYLLDLCRKNSQNHHQYTINGREH